MKTSLVILFFFVLGILGAWGGILPPDLITDDVTLYLLYTLMTFVGISLGCDSRLREILSTLKPKNLLLPLGTTIGTFLASALVSFVIARPLSHTLACGAGFAYYSLSSILISQHLGSELGTVALIANILRESLTLLLVPLVAKFLPPAAVISLGGATTMDTTLPILVRSLGKEWTFVAVLHAVILDFSVPFWVTLFCSL